VLTGSYTYSDTEGDPEGVSTFRWLRGTTPIAGATARTYTLVAADERATVSFEVTPVAQTGTSPGRPVVSAGAGPVAAPTNLPPMASNVLITGTADIGQVLTGSYTYTDCRERSGGRLHLPLAAGWHAHRRGHGRDLYTGLRRSRGHGEL
jgi:hypothetical protein